jgi:hypothetical protein
VKFVDAAVEGAAIEQFEVEGGGALEDWVRPALAADHREDRQLDAVDQAGDHQRPGQRRRHQPKQRRPEACNDRHHRSVGATLDEGSAVGAVITAPSLGGCMVSSAKPSP